MNQELSAAHGRAEAVHAARYSFCHVHGTTRITPVMAVGVTDHVWGLDELVGAAAISPAFIPRPPLS
ncbi:MAG: hypothetical protein ABSB42_18260 [Tepidisphaeraceae bacterium]